MYMVKVYDKVMSEKTFFDNVRLCLRGEDDSVFSSSAIIEDIQNAFEDYIKDNYSAFEVFMFTEEDKAGVISDFTEGDIMAEYLDSDDYQFLEVQGECK